jgi:hypothetical protein
LSKRSLAVASRSGDPGDPGSWTGPLGRLHTLVVPSKIDPPVETRQQVLPFECLAWENFERLCLRLAIGRGEVIHSADHGGTAADGRRSARDALDARLYGVRGQDQQGIDLYVRLVETPDGRSPERRYLCLQSRRVAKLTAAKLKKAVSDFLAGKWPRSCRVFVYATSLAAVRRELADEVRVQTERLRREGIEFAVWDAELMSPWLKDEPSLVYDFFGHAWAEHFCGREAVDQLGTRLDAGQVGELRDQMRRFYTALFDATDSGMIGLRQANAPRLSVRERFILPDVLVNGQPARGRIAIPGAAAESPGLPSLASEADAGVVASWYQQAHATRYGRARLPAARAVPAGDAAVLQPQDEGGSGLPFASAAPPVRTDPDTWLASGDRHVLVGTPGSGKTTFLRHLVLDMLSDSPSLTLWTRRLGDRLPVWLPFHFFTWRQAMYRDANASLAATLRAWLEQHDAAALWPLVEVALQDERLLLIVDGLDEWVSESAGRSAVTGLETFLGTREVPALVSARPYGLDRMPLAADWDYAGIAELSAGQQRKLAGLWFDAATPGPGPLASDSQGLDDFIAEVEGKAELRQLAATPMFLLLLVGLRLSGVPLPERRFEVYEAVVTQLLKDHPAARAAAARVAAEDGGLAADDVRQVLAHLAFQWQERGEFAPVQDSTVRADLAAALKDPGHLAMDAQSAARMARTLTEIAEGQLGVLVRYGRQDLGFLHRVFLEQLASEHAADRLPADDRVDLFARRARDPRWSQVLLGVLWRTRRPAENSALVQAIADQADGSRPGSLTARELLAEAIFAGFRLPAADTARHALAVLDAIETHPHIPHRQRLLTASVAGLPSPAGRLLRERLRRWTLAPHPVPPGLFHHLGRAASDSELGQPLWPVLVAALAMEDPACAASAAIALAGRYGATGSAQARDGVLRALRNAATASHAAIALGCLVLAWPSDPATQEMVTWGRRQQALPVRVTALGAVLGVLRRALTTAGAPECPVPGAQPVSQDERNWLISLLHSRDEHDSMWRLVTAHALATVLRDDPVAWQKARDESLEILDKQHDTLGDRGLAWATILLCRPEDPAILGFVCGIFRTDPHYVHFLGHAPLPTAYKGHPSVAQAIEDSLHANPHAYMDSQLHALASIDHGPAMKNALLESLTSSPFPHWAAGALATYWEDDEEARTALRTVLEGEPVRASYAAPAAERVLGREAAVSRMLALLAMPRNGQQRIRADIIAIALADIYRDESGVPGTDADRVAAACLEHLPYPGNEYEATAESEIVTALGATQAARDRARSMLARPQIPLTTLTAGYARDPEALRPILRRLNEAFPSLPAQLRAYLCALLRDSAADRPLARDLTRQWADDPDDQVAVAASAAFHTHLRHDHDGGTLPPAEWDAALAAIRREAVRRSFRRWGRQRGAWTGALLLDRLSALDDLRGGQVPARLNLGDTLGPADMTLLSAVADGWPALRAHFGDQLLTWLSEDSLFNHDNGTTWNYLALVADRQHLLGGELARAVADQPALLDNDGVLAWYASAHRGDENLTDILISRLDDGTNARALASMLLADPRDLGLAPDTVQERLRSLFHPDRLWYPPFQSGALETLSDGFPDDELVRKIWDMIADARKRGEPAGMHPRTYYALAYAAVPAEELLDLLARDTERMAAWGDTYFDTHFSRAITRRLRRDVGARAEIEAFILTPGTADAPASCFASLTAAAFPLSDELAGNLTTRLQQQLRLPAPDMTHDYLSGSDIPVPVLLLQILHSGIGANP